jgi:pyrroline-5-carboxylate reductase
MNSSDYQTILIIGAGNMGTSIASGLLAKGCPANLITFCEQNLTRHVALNKTFPASNIVSDPAQLTTPCKIVLLAVKPNDMESVCLNLSTIDLPSNTLFISIAAGVPVSAFQNWLGNQAIIVRCMPNTPAAIGLGMTGLYSHSNTNSLDRTLADHILSSTGKTIWVDKETMLDAVTALSGSGPAYLFYLMECLQESGKTLGLSAQDSYTLTLQTMLGAAQLAQQQNIDFETLRANVTSKGGTTELAINCFKQNDMKQIIDSALKAAAARAGEISQSFTKE